MIGSPHDYYLNCMEVNNYPYMIIMSSDTEGIAVMTN